MSSSIYICTGHESSFIVTKRDLIMANLQFLNKVICILNEDSDLMAHRFLHFFMDYYRRTFFKTVPSRCRLSRTWCYSQHCERRLSDLQSSQTVGCLKCMCRLPSTGVAVDKKGECGFTSHLERQ